MLFSLKSETGQCFRKQDRKRFERNKTTLRKMVRTSSRPNSQNPVSRQDIPFCGTVFASNRMSLQLYLYALGAITLTRIHEVGLKHMQPLLCWSVHPQLCPGLACGLGQKPTQAQQMAGRCWATQVQS
jgi:hypothetical protein